MIPALTVLIIFAQLASDLPAVEREIAAGHYSTALSTLEATPAASRTAAWYLLASKASDGLNDVRKAVEFAQSAIELEPSNEPAYLQLGQIFLSRNTPEAAAEIFGEANELFPGSVLVHLGLGLALKDLERFEQAAAVLTNTLIMKPDLGTAFDAIGAVYLDDHKYEKLCTVAAQYIERNPGDYRGYYYLAAAKQKLGDAAAEVQVLVKRSLALNARFAAGHALLGKLMLDNGQDSDAISHLELAIQLRPSYTPAHMYLVTAYTRAGRRDDAQRAAARLAQLKQQESQPAPHLVYHRGDPSKSPSRDHQ